MAYSGNESNWTKAYAEVNGLNMYYEIYGEGEPLVLIHGGGSTIETSFGRIIPLLMKKRKLITLTRVNGHKKLLMKQKNIARFISLLQQKMRILPMSLHSTNGKLTLTVLMFITHPTKPLAEWSSTGYPISHK